MRRHIRFHLWCNPSNISERTTGKFIRLKYTAKGIEYWRLPSLEGPPHCVYVSTRLPNDIIAFFGLFSVLGQL